jgi:hypothetical protein
MDGEEVVDQKTSQKVWLGNKGCLLLHPLLEEIDIWFEGIDRRIGSRVKKI